MNTSLPIGGGLGSSASFTSNCVTGFLVYYGIIPHGPLSQEHLDLINQWTFVGETLIHGKASGLDNTLCVLGGTRWYQQGCFKQVHGLETLPFLLTNTEVPKNTLKQVASLKELRDAFPDVIDPLMDAIGNISEEIVNLLKGTEDALALHSSIHVLFILDSSFLEIDEIKSWNLKNVWNES